MPTEARIVDNATKGFLADLAFADVLMPVHARAEVGLGIVQVEGEDLLQPDHRAHLSDGRIPALGGPDVEAGGE